MKPSEVLSIPVSLGSADTVTPQPSIEEIVRAHYRLGLGAAGDTVADAYIERVRLAIDAAAGAAPGERTAAEEPAPENMRERYERAEKPSADLLESFKIKMEIGGHDLLDGMRKASAGDTAALGPILGGLFAVALGQGTRKRD